MNRVQSENLKRVIDNNTVKPNIEFDSLKCRPSNDKYNSLVGVTFDYLARFEIQRYNNTNAKESPWISEDFISQLKLRYPTVYEDLKSVVEKSKKTKSKYISDGNNIDNLIRNTIPLAKIECNKRRDTASFRSLQNLDDINKDEIVGELNCLMNILKNNIEIFDANKILLNPSFGLSSKIVGCDGDVILDNTIIEFKTTKHKKFKRRYWRQLVVYYCLAYMNDKILDEVDLSSIRYNQNKSRFDIDYVGLYFARFGSYRDYEIQKYINGDIDRICRLILNEYDYMTNFDEKEMSLIKSVF